MMQVREIMTNDPACCTPDSSLQEVAQMMEKNDCGCIPVVDSFASKKPIGTITDRDITIRTVAANHNPISMKASDIMTRDIATVTPQMSVEEVFDVMEDREIRRVLVVDEQGKCCGIVAQADVVQSTANPERTTKVIREISESAPSRNPAVSMSRRPNGRGYQSHSSSQSYMGGGSILPLFVGLGSGMALMYLLNSRQNREHRYYGGDRFTYDHVDRMNATNEENFGRYVDAEQEIEKRQHDLEGRVQTLKTDLDSPVNTRADAMFDKDDTNINRKGRGAGQS